MTFQRPTTIVAAALACAAGLIAAVSPAIATSGRASGRVWFPRNVLPLAHATDLGATRPSQVMTIGIGLRDPNAAAEGALLAQQRDPASPLYGHWLTPAQFNARFALPAATYSRLLGWLRGGGAHVAVTTPSRDYVAFKASVAQIDRLFTTSIHDYVAGGTRFAANATPPSVPAGMDVLAIMGLNTLVHPTTPLQGAHRSDRAPSSDRLGTPTSPGTATVPGVAAVPALGKGASLASGTPARPAAPAAGTPQIPTALTPQDLWSIYDMPSNNLGDGQTIAIMGSGDSSTTVKDLPIFEDHHHLPHVPIAVTDTPAGGNFSDAGGSIEWELDTQASTGIAAHASQVHLYFGEHLIDPDVEAAFTTWVNDPNGPSQANASFGECETTPANATLESPTLTQLNNNEDPNAQFGTGAPNALEPVAEQTLRQGALEGRTLFASTGDTGSSCPVLVLGPLGAGNGVANQGVPLPNYPSVSQYVVAVGGTVLYSDGGTPPQRAQEYPWPFTGGGQSFFIPEPSFQAGDSNVNRPCLSDVNGNPNTAGTICRGIPDVADESGDIATSSYDIYSDELGGDSGEGGTSLSSPLMVGMWTRIQAASARGGTGFADPLIYRIGENATQYARDFNDYTVGSNGFYTAGPGWDYVTGWGTPDLAHLMGDIDSGNTAPVNHAPLSAGNVAHPGVAASGAGSAPTSGVKTATGRFVACPTSRRLTYTVHGHTRNRRAQARVVLASVYINGALVKRARGHSLNTVTISRPLLTRYTVRIVTTLSTGGHVTSVRSYKGCTRNKVRHKAKHAKRRRTKQSKRKKA